MQRSLKTRFFAVANEDSISNKRAAMLLAHPKEQKEKANQGSSTSCNAANFFSPYPSLRLGLCYGGRKVEITGMRSLSVQKLSTDCKMPPAFPAVLPT